MKSAPCIHSPPLRLQIPPAPVILLALACERRHIVLAVYHTPSRRFGALGLSRRDDLMYKELQYDTLAELMLDFKMSYEKWWHQLLKIRVGLPADQNPTYSGPVCWR